MKFGYIYLLTRYHYLILVPLFIYQQIGHHVDVAFSAVYWLIAALFNTQGIVVFPKRALWVFRAAIATSGISTLYWNNWTNIYVHIWLFCFCFCYHVPAQPEPKQFRREWTIVGLIIAGLPYTLLGEYLLAYLGLLVAISLFFGHIHASQYISINKEKVSLRVMFIAIAHNFHYYAYSIFIPIITIQLQVHLALVGVVFAVGWSLFLYNKPIARYIAQRFSLKLVIASGFLMTIPVLIMLGLTQSILLFCLGWGLTSLTSGLSESFFLLQTYSKHAVLYSRGWIIGGGLGALVGGVSAAYFGIYVVFFVSAVACAVGCITSLMVKGEQHL